MAPKLIQCIKFSFSLTAGAVNKQKKRTTYSSSVFACSRGTNTCAPSIVYRLLIGWNCQAQPWGPTAYLLRIIFAEQVLLSYTITFISNGWVFEWLVAGILSPGGTQQIFTGIIPAPRSMSLPFHKPFLTEKVPLSYTIPSLLAVEGWRGLLQAFENDPRLYKGQWQERLPYQNQTCALFCSFFFFSNKISLTLRNLQLFEQGSLYAISTWLWQGNRQWQLYR